MKSLICVIIIVFAMNFTFSQEKGNYIVLINNDSLKIELNSNG